MVNKELDMYFKRVSFNDDFDCVADMNTEPIYLKLVRNIVEISDEQGLTNKELTQKPTEKGQTVKELEREVERLKGLIKARERSSHYTFYSHATTMTDSQIENQFKERWQQFKTENNL